MIARDLNFIKGLEEVEYFRRVLVVQKDKSIYSCHPRVYEADSKHDIKRLESHMKIK